jgi:phosphoglycerate kinase
MNTSLSQLSTLNATMLRGKYVLVRAGVNVPLVNGKVADGFRVKKALQTIRYLKKVGARVIVIAHIGRDSKESLLPVVRYMNTKTRIGFAPDVFGAATEAMIANMKNGTALMLENLRQYEEEKGNNIAFAKKLAGYADIYVNDAFSVSHRAHASIVSIPKYLPSYIGLSFEEEYGELMRMREPKKPFVLVLGGAKMKTKLPLLSLYAKKGDMVCVGGAIANTLLKARGYEIGKSIADDTKGLSALVKKKNILLPIDVVVETAKKERVVREISEIQKKDTIVDIGPETVRRWEEVLSKAKSVVMNGPLGWYEKGYVKGTKDVLKIIAGTSARSVVGGGDTVALVRSAKMSQDMTFLSTAGGAMLDYLADGSVPGIEAIADRN